MFSQLFCAVVSAPVSFKMIFFQKLSYGCSDTETRVTEVPVALTHNIYVCYHFVTFIFIRVKQSAFLEQRREACVPVINSYFQWKGNAEAELNFRYSKVRVSVSH